MSETFKQLIKGMQAANWSLDELNQVRAFVEDEKNGRLLSASVGENEVILNCVNGKIKVTRGIKNPKKKIKVININLPIFGHVFEVEKENDHTYSVEMFNGRLATIHKIDCEVVE